MIRQFWRRAVSAAATGGALSLLAMPAAAQIPVIDPAAIAKQIEQISELPTQLETAKDQLTQLQNLHGSLNKLTNMGDIAALLSNPEVRQALPKDFGQLEAALKGQGAGALGSRTATYRQENEVYARSGDDFYAAETRRTQLANAGQRNVAQQVYEAAAKRMDGLDELRRQIGQIEDPKTTLDPQACIGSESAQLQNELLKMQALHMLQQAEVQTREQRAREDWDRRIESTIGHPFLTQRGWVRSFQLRAGDKLTIAGQAQDQLFDVVVCRIRRTARQETVHNLHTTGENNFIVSGVVAHNFSILRSLRGWLQNIRHQLAQKFPLRPQPRPDGIQVR